jgi:cyclic-di-GMP-binding protein
MAVQHSFDIVSTIDMQEVDNAFNQTKKEMLTRYDFKGSKSSIELQMKDRKLVITADDDYKRRAIIDILESKFVKRGISLKAMQLSDTEDASGSMLRQSITLQNGIDKDKARMIVKMIKDLKLRVQAAIQEDQVRVTAAKIDDLQLVMAHFRTQEFDFDMQFINYR